MTIWSYIGKITSLFGKLKVGYVVFSTKETQAHRGHLCDDLPGTRRPTHAHPLSLLPWVQHRPKIHLLWLLYGQNRQWVSFCAFTIVYCVSAMTVSCVCVFLLWNINQYVFLMHKTFHLLRVIGWTVCVFPVYDVLTGSVETRLSGHDACVRDVSWHPFEDNIISSSVSPVLEPERESLINDIQVKGALCKILQSNLCFWWSLFMSLLTIRHLKLTSCRTIAQSR